MIYSHQHFETIDSTNKYLKDHFDEVNNLTFVSSDYQSLGRGRMDRKWFSPQGENLLFSILIKDKELINRFHNLSILSAYVISKFFEDNYDVKCQIKWPNDVYINSKKVTGILLESHMDGSSIDGIIIGIGNNINQTIFSDDYRITPTSIKLETNRKIDIQSMYDPLFSLFERIFNEFKSKGMEEYISFINERNYLYGKTAKVIINNKDIIGTVKNINLDCSIQLDDGEMIHNISSGEINLL